MSTHIRQTITVPDSLAGKRLDQIVAELLPEFSRSRIKGWIESGHLKVDGNVEKPREKLYGGEEIVVDVMLEDISHHQGEDIPLNIIYEDDDILVINKQTGFVVHPGAGNQSGTLLNALLHYAPDIAHIPRCGIVHRLDKDTTGLMVVAKSLLAQTSLVEQLQTREMGREYEAVTIGVLTGGGKIDEPISRHSTQRTKMTVHPTGKDAVTHYRLIKRYRNHTHVRVKLETGRTHQIRVHMAYINYPLLGDHTYGMRLRALKNVSPELATVIRGFPRQALHAAHLELYHPRKEERMAWDAPLPDDFVTLLAALEEDAVDFDPDY